MQLLHNALKKNHNLINKALFEKRSHQVIMAQLWGTIYNLPNTEWRESRSLERLTFKKWNIYFKDRKNREKFKTPRSLYLT